MNDVLNGTLDFAFTKPADAQALVSVREFRFWQLTDAIVGLAILGIAVAQLQAALTGFQILEESSSFRLERIFRIRHNSND